MKILHLFRSVCDSLLFTVGDRRQRSPNSCQWQFHCMRIKLFMFMLTMLVDMRAGLFTSNAKTRGVSFHTQPSLEKGHALRSRKTNRNYSAMKKQKIKRSRQTMHSPPLRCRTRPLELEFRAITVWLSVTRIVKCDKKCDVDNPCQHHQMSKIREVLHSVVQA